MERAVAVSDNENRMLSSKRRLKSMAIFMNKGIGNRNTAKSSTMFKLQVDKFQGAYARHEPGSLGFKFLASYSQSAMTVHTNKYLKASLTGMQLNMLNPNMKIQLQTSNVMNM
jgi:hypothetical protein